MTVQTIAERRENGLRNAFTGLVGAALLAACGDVQEPTMSVELKTAHVSDKEVAASWKAVKAVCPQLFERHLADMVSISAKALEPYADYRLAKGWTWEVEFSVRLDPDLRTFPVEVRNMPTLVMFFVNTGPEGVPGVFIKARAAHVACGRDLGSPGSDTFVEIVAQ